MMPTCRQDLPHIVHWRRRLMRTHRRCVCVLRKGARSRTAGRTGARSRVRCGAILAAAYGRRATGDGIAREDVLATPMRLNNNSPAGIRLYSLRITALPHAHAHTSERTTHTQKSNTHKRLCVCVCVRLMRVFCFFVFFNMFFVSVRLGSRWTKARPPQISSVPPNIPILH